MYGYFSKEKEKICTKSYIFKKNNKKQSAKCPYLTKKLYLCGRILST